MSNYSGLCKFSALKTIVGLFILLRKQWWRVSPIAVRHWVNGACCAILSIEGQPLGVCSIKLCISLYASCIELDILICLFFRHLTSEYTSKPSMRATGLICAHGKAVQKDSPIRYSASCFSFSFFPFFIKCLWNYISDILCCFSLYLAVCFPFVYLQNSLRKHLVLHAERRIKPTPSPQDRSPSKVQLCLLLKKIP